MGKLLARFISVVFHPLFIPLYCVLIIFNSPVYIIYQLNIDAKYAVCAVVAVFTLVLPAVSTVMLLKMDGIKSLKMNSQEERKLPFIMSAIFYATAYFSMQQVGIPKLITNAILGATISLVILFLANFKQKTSAHMVGIGGLLGIVYTLSEIYIVGISQFLFPSIILAGLIGYSRLKLKAHQSIEIYSGLIIGFFSEYLIL
ncbi:MAG: hypothetical protein HOB26_05925 [Flavobacteriales bacterium]|jgi:hypothetical protein|nr:hypothetical protein [Flavobacteriales bacterium]